MAESSEHTLPDKDLNPDGEITILCLNDYLDRVQEHVAEEREQGFVSARGHYD